MENQAVSEEYATPSSPHPVSSVATVATRPPTAVVAGSSFDEDRGCLVPPTGGTQYTYGELAEDRNKTNWYAPRDRADVLVLGNVPEKDRGYLSAYLGGLLEERGCYGQYKVWKMSVWQGRIWTFRFDKLGVCPLCRVKHDSYGFEYKVKHGCYGGWKCWKAGEDLWETQYHYGELPRLTDITPPEV